MKSVLLIVTTAILSACGNYHDSLKAAQAIDASAFRTMSFAATEALVFGPACAHCHGASNAAAGLNLESYAALLPRIAQIRSAVASGEMPLGGPALSDEQKEILFNWIDAGAPETSNLPLTKETQP